MTAPILVAADPATVDHAPARFGALVAGFTGAPVRVVGGHASDEEIDRLSGAQFGEDLEFDSGGAARRRRASTWRPSARPSTSAPRGLELAGVGFVDTDEGRAAPHAAHALARRSGARLRVLVAVLPRGWMGDGTPEALDEAAADARVRAGTAAEAAAGGLLGAAVDVDVEVLEPAAWLVEVSEDVDLLVCGSRGYGARPATLLGGVTRRLTAGASCPVIVLARGAEVPLEAIVADA